MQAYESIVTEYLLSWKPALQSGGLDQSHIEHAFDEIRRLGLAERGPSKALSKQFAKISFTPL